MRIMKHGFINLYRSGWYHREGKPGNLDRHAGDVYNTMDEALQNIDPPSHYITTIGITWVDVEDVQPNPADSVPVGLAISRARAREAQQEMVEELA